MCAQVEGLLEVRIVIASNEVVTDGRGFWGKLPRIVHF